MSRHTITLLFINLIFFISAKPMEAQNFEKVPELHGDMVTFPLTLTHVYPFISGSVNGVTGKFMFDTGAENAIILNDNYVKLPNKKIKGTGHSGSGESFRTHISDTVSELSFTNDITYRNLEKITSGNYDFIQKHIVPDFLGFFGYKFFKGYLFKIDYLHRKVTFYKNTTERNTSRDFLANEKILAVIGFETEKLENNPHVKLKVSGVDVLGSFDTGQNGFLQLDDPSAKVLKAKGAVIYSGTDGGGDTLLTVRNIIMDGKFKTSLKGVEYSTLEHTRTMRKETGVNAPNLMTLGYRFLLQYKTVWDYERKKIYILEY